MAIFKNSTMKEFAGRMKILILYSISLEPMIGMSQVRVYNQIKYLSLHNMVDFASVNNSLASIEDTNRRISPYVNAYYPIKKSYLGKNKIERFILKSLKFIKYYLSYRPMADISVSTGHIKKCVREIISKGDYDVVIFHYWYMGYLLKYVPDNIIKVIDTHNAIEEKIELFNKGYYKTRNRYRLKKELEYSLKKQLDYFKYCDLIVVNSSKQADIFKTSIPEEKIVIAENGQDLSEFLEYKCPIDNDSILFYGSLSNQFNRLALKRILNKIYPGILKLHPKVKLIIAGSYPPLDLLNKYNYPDVVITGFIEDIKPIIGRCAVMLLPLETASGFRGRLVEVMALGVPVIGTHNGLQSVGMQDGVQGYYAESDEEIIKKAIMVINNPELRQKLSEQCRKFVQERYTLEATFGKMEASLESVLAKRNKLRRD